MRRQLVGALALVVVGAGLSLVPGAPGLVASASAAASLDRPNPDVPEAVGVPIQELPAAEDPTAAVDGLADELSDVPADTVGQIEADPSWTDVPQLPVEVRVPDGVMTEQPADDAPPSDGASDSSSEEPSDEAPTDQPSDGPSAVATGDPSEDGSNPNSPPSATDTDTDADDVVGEPEVEITWDRADDLSDGVVLLSVAPTADPTGEVAGAGVRVDYSSFDSLYGAGWSDRLVIRAYPACYATTPELAECAQSIQIPAANNTAEDLLRFTTISTEDLATGLAAIDDSSLTRSTDGDQNQDGSDSEDPAAEDPTVQEPADLGQAGDALPARLSLSTDPVGGVVYSLSSAPGGYGPTPVAPAGEWQVGPGSGEFSYSYGFKVPPSVGGAAPSLSMVYSSAAVDGMTKAENGQASPAGVGWSLDPGYISRSYASCGDDPAFNDSNKDDLCWHTEDGKVVDELTLSLNGQVARLVPTGVGDRFRLKSDPGWRIQRFNGVNGPSNSSVVNADNDDEGFRVNTPDGTQYWFGYADAANAVWTVPVFGNDAGEPCNAASGSNCPQAWRWNLDRVVDPSGNVITYSYTTESNKYYLNGNFAAPTSYVSGGLLNTVAYGFKSSGTTAQKTPHMKVVFDHGNRCTLELQANPVACTGTNSPTANHDAWPDVPTDLICNSLNDPGCATGPSFFTTQRYSKVTTSVRLADASWDTVDVYDLTYSLPDPDASGAGTSPADLWLKSITRTGYTGAGSQSLPDLTFTGVAKPNKVVASGIEAFEKFRIASVRNETGGRLDVTYGHVTGKACSTAIVKPNGTDIEPDSITARTRECFAELSHKAGDRSKTETSWYHKYVVTRMAVGDDTLGLRMGSTTTPGVSLGKVGVYDYDYQGSPAWRFAGSKNVPTDLESWSDWRGYMTTIIHTRAATKDGTLVGDGTTDVARQKVTRFRGMNLAPTSVAQVDNPALPRNKVHLDTDEFADDGTNDTTTAEPLDLNDFEGLTAETSAFNGDGSLIERTYTDYDRIVTVGDEESPANEAARMRVTKTVKTHTAIYDEDGDLDGSRTHTIDYGYYRYDPLVTPPTGWPTSRTDPLNGALRSVWDHGDTGTADDKCEMTRYQTDATAWIRVPNENKGFKGNCPTTDSSTTAIVSRSTVTYDDGTTLTRGLPTATDTWVTPAGNPTTGVNVIHTTSAYDSYGRVTQTVGPGDTAHELTTQTMYNWGTDSPEAITSMQVTQQNVLNPSRSSSDMVTTTTLDPGRGLPTEVVDANGGHTQIKYNPLGQATEVYTPDQTGTTNPSVRYIYTNSNTFPSRIRTQTLRSVNTSGVGTYDDSYSFYDGWGRQVETQVPQPETPTKRIVTATGYDERGLARYTMPATDGGTGFATVFDADMSTVVRYTQTSFDGAGRPTLSEDKSYTSTVADTSSMYGGDKTTVDPPVGGNTLTLLDVWNRPTAVELHDTADVTDTPDDAVSYTYNTRGELDHATKTIDAASYTWSYGYDMVGRQIWALDPDTGLTTTTYDDAGNPRTVTTGEIGTKADALDLTTNGAYRPIALHPTSVITTNYDRLNRATSVVDETDPDDDAPPVLTTWTYDDPAVINSAGLVTSISHDVDDSIRPPTIPLGTAHTHLASVNAYNPEGLATSTSESYAGWITDENVNGTITRTTTTAYNAGGQPTQIDYPAVPGLPAASIGYSYTTGARLRTMRLIEANQPPLRLAQIAYNNIGRTDTLTSGEYTDTTQTATLVSGLTRAYDFADDTGLFAYVGATVQPPASGGQTQPSKLGLSLAYAYDGGGNPTSIEGYAETTSDFADHPGFWCYHYDGLNRLTHAQTGDAAGCPDPEAAPGDVVGYLNTTLPNPVSATYDLTYGHQGDRLTRVTDNLHTTLLSSDPLEVNYLTEDANADDAGLRPHHTTKLTHQALGANFNWPNAMPIPGVIVNDTNGRIEHWSPDEFAGILSGLLNNTAYAYTYNHLGQLTYAQAERGINGLFTDTQGQAYNADGTRFARRVFSSDPNKVGREVTTIDLADDTEITRTTFLNKTESVRSFTTPDGTPIATQTTTSASNTAGGTNHDAQWTWLTADAQNSIRLTYNQGANGNTAGDIARPTYYPYGDLTTTQAPATGNRAGYLNHPHDPTGDIRLDQRNYTPNLNTLGTPDPVLDPGDPQSFNPYTYARNNPISGSDPSGLYRNEVVDAAYGHDCPYTCAYDSDEFSLYGGNQGTGPYIDPVSATIRDLAQEFAGGVASLVVSPVHMFEGAALGLSGDPVTPGGRARQDRGAELIEQGENEFTHGAVVVAPYLIPLPGGPLAALPGRLAAKLAARGLAKDGLFGIMRGAVGRALTRFAERNAANGVDIAGARFAQTAVREGFQKGGLFEGRTINDVAGDLRSGALTPKDVPINVVVRDGNTLILNTRSATALTRAGVPRSSWNVLDRTGDDFFEGLLNEQLRRNGLNSSGYVFSN
ncbi:RHS repeat-associated core domain-containing protein [Nocardioides sp. MH1]|uniref:RHS repeat-associated core domain-containing protein n=1 Tax=Nocardioides sp. MH1 TaxID=3242490 RepID=UPI003520B7A1